VAQRLFGHVPGYPVGSHSASRTELSEAGVHRPTVAGISGGELEGAGVHARWDSVNAVLSDAVREEQPAEAAPLSREVGDGFLTCLGNFSHEIEASAYAL
jgi:SAD/SRA domain